MKKRSLVFSIAYNGYHGVYDKNIRSHMLYAKAQGYEYSLVRKPGLTSLRRECIWVKIPLLLAALDAGFEWVCYLDSDTSISRLCPALESLQAGGKSLYMANGFSGRVNAGVIIAYNTPESKFILRRILSNHAKQLPPEDDVGWGDNGHVIHYTRDCPELCVIDDRWNNNHSPKLDDFIRHYSAGPMRPLYHMSIKGRFYYACSKVTNLAFKLLSNNRTDGSTFEERLYKLYRTGAEHHSQHFSILPQSYFFSEELREQGTTHSK